MNQFTEKYEGNIGRPYSELSSEDQNPDVWGNVEYKGQMVNIYTSPAVTYDLFTEVVEKNVTNQGEITIGADLGGAEGTVASMVQDQLNRDGYPEAHVLNYDLIEKNLELMRSKFPKLLGEQADLRIQLPLNNNSIDFAILRYVLPYLTLEDQKTVLQNVFNALKDQGSLVILQDGGFSKEVGKLYNQLFAESSAAQSGILFEEVSANRHFTSAEELCEMAREVGFEVEEARDLTEVLKGYLSPEAYASRFNMSDQQLHDLQEVYMRWKENGQLEFTDDLENPLNVRTKRPTIYLVLRKIASEKQG